MNGWIYVWYHVNDQDPKWMPKEFEEFKKGTKYAEYSSLFNCHIIVKFDLLIPLLFNTIIMFLGHSIQSI